MAGLGLSRGLRVHPADELTGLDSVYHGCPAKKKKKKAGASALNGKRPNLKPLNRKPLSP